MSRAILFVCTGNICRSPMAEALFRDMLQKEGITDVEVFSRGVGVWGPQPMMDIAVESLKRIDVPAHEHFSQALSDEDVDRADLILVMTGQHLKVVLRNYPDAEGKVRLLADEEIGDPVGGSEKQFDQCRTQIHNALKTLLKDLQSPQK